MRTFHFYMDDSGTRHPDLKESGAGNQPNWFALGGVIVEEKLEDALKESIKDFKERWHIDYPLHSCNIRQRNERFAWLKGNAETTKEFLDDLTKLIVTAPVVGHACVIDRPSYNRRYKEKYGNDRWSLCNTAFTIAVERAAKYAMSQGGRLRVFVEGSSRPDEQKLRTYYNDLKGVGNPFDSTRSSTYKPLSRDDLSKTLFEFRVKKKTSPIMQLADLYLYPISRGGYDPNYPAYKCLCENKKLINQLLDPNDIPSLGIKYSCFDLPLEELKKYA